MVNAGRDEVDWGRADFKDSSNNNSPLPLGEGQGVRGSSGETLVKVSPMGALTKPGVDVGLVLRTGQSITVVFRRTDIPVCRRLTGKNACPPDTY
jgi:hypothetical protein